MSTGVDYRNINLMSTVVDEKSPEIDSVPDISEQAMSTVVDVINGDVVSYTVVLYKNVYYGRLSLVHRSHKK